MNQPMSTDMTVRYNEAGDEGAVPEPNRWLGRVADRFARLLPERFADRSSLLLNASLVAALLLVAGLTVWTVRGSDAEPVSAAQTVKVGTGDVTATVSANGNVASGSTVNLEFQGTGGIVTEILVKEGDQVEAGQVLARVDSTSAQQSLRKALAQLASAQAAYDDTIDGQTEAEEDKDDRSVDQAEASLDSAETSLTSAKQSLSLTTSQQNAAVSRASNDLTSARAALNDARSDYTANPTTENKQAVTDATREYEEAERALEEAKQNRDSAILQAKQQVSSAEDSLDSAEASLESTEATVDVNQEGASDSEIASARAQVVEAQVGVSDARDTLSDTELRTTVAGTVTAINGEVGQSASYSSDGDSESDSGSASGAGGTSGSSGSSSTTDTSGFITLTGTNSLQVTADVAEADISDVKIGDPATITLSASDKEVPGSVTAIDSIETVTNNVVEYGVTVTLSSTDGIKLGQSTQVEITTDSKDSVLRVATSALTTVGERTTATVRQSDGTTRTVQVVKGLEGDGFTEVLSGLKAGDTVEIPKQSGASGGFTFPGGGIGRIGG